MIHRIIRDQQINQQNQNNQQQTNNSSLNAFAQTWNGGNNNFQNAQLQNTDSRNVSKDTPSTANSGYKNDVGTGMWGNSSTNDAVAVNGSNTLTTEMKKMTF